LADVNDAHSWDLEYRAGLVRFALGYLRDGAAAEDAVQDVLVKALIADEPPRDPRAWLFRATRNHCLNLLRGGSHRAGETLPDDLLLRTTGDLTRMVREEQRLALARLVEELPLEQREVLRLRYGEDLSREEIGAVLELPVSVVKSRLYEGMQRLRRGAARL
jgi:RNA polymerase sigma-70 factor, ECF subfamily